MTDREKAIVQAHTGIVMLEGEKFNLFYEYLEELYGRPVYTHEIPFIDMKEKSRPDFIKLCREDTPSADDWDRYSTKLWKEAYERGKRDAQPTQTNTSNALDTLDCVSRQDAIKTSLEFFVEFLGGAFDENSQKELIARFQRLHTAQPRMRGRWELSSLTRGPMRYCSECEFGQCEKDERFYSFCPNCGADMREGEG